MANRYGEAALLATRMETHGKGLTAGERWEEGVRKVYPTTPAGQKKAGPRQAFIGLCEAGLVKGIEAEEGQANRNKRLAVEAAGLLAAGTLTTVSQLWAGVTKGEAIAHASQMDVVLALWKNGLIVPR